MRYLVVIERTETGFRASCPDLDGCVATGGTRADVEGQIGRVVDFHVCALRRAGEAPPPARADAWFVEVGSLAGDMAGFAPGRG
ncbi:MAG: type II toxin-antitoxin system HicB family antitoxin [Gemmatimonadota bacterium]